MTEVCTYSAIAVSLFLDKGPRSNANEQQRAVGHPPRASSPSSAQQCCASISGVSHSDLHKKDQQDLSATQKTEHNSWQWHISWPYLSPPRRLRPAVWGLVQRVSHSHLHSQDQQKTSVRPNKPNPTAGHTLVAIYVSSFASFRSNAAMASFFPHMVRPRLPVLLRKVETNNSLSTVIGSQPHLSLSLSVAMWARVLRPLRPLLPASPLRLLPHRPPPHVPVLRRTAASTPPSSSSSRSSGAWGIYAAGGVALAATLGFGVFVFGACVLPACLPACVHAACWGVCRWWTVGCGAVGGLVAGVSIGCNMWTWVDARVSFVEQCWTSCATVGLSCSSFRPSFLFFFFLLLGQPNPLEPVLPGACRIFARGSQPL